MECRLVVEKAENELCIELYDSAKGLELVRQQIKV